MDTGQRIDGAHAVTLGVALDHVTDTVAQSNSSASSTGKALVKSAAAVSAQPDGDDAAWQRVRSRLRAQLGDDVFTSWFAKMQLESTEGETVRISLPTRFLKNWIETHYTQELVDCCRQELAPEASIILSIRRPGYSKTMPAAASKQAGETAAHAATGGQRADAANTAAAALPPPREATEAGGFDGSPLDPALTFETFVVGTSNQLAQAAARQVAESVLDRPLRFNPLFLHGKVGMGKTHLLHAIAWDVKRRFAKARVLYLTAEQFRYRFVEAVRSQKALSFKEQIRNIDMLIIDDMEFLQGQQTEQEFDHTLNALLDSGRQVVVASANPPSSLEMLDNRMRSRLGQGLVVELSNLDYDLRRRILERRVAEKQELHPSFTLGADVIEFLAERLQENARELDGAVTRLYAAALLGQILHDVFGRLQRNAGLAK
ncbi:MAG: DnaA/Hda family protein, partial [Pseudomonadota bacterium]